MPYEEENEHETKITPIIEIGETNYHISDIPTL